MLWNSYWFRLYLAIILTVVTSGCVSQQAVLKNDKGQQASCSAAGFGLISSIIASNNFEACKERALAAGYK